MNEETTKIYETIINHDIMYLDLLYGSNSKFMYKHCRPLFGDIDTSKVDWVEIDTRILKERDENIGEMS